jgi:hypothetical protein
VNFDSPNFYWHCSKKGDWREFEPPTQCLVPIGTCIGGPWTICEDEADDDANRAWHREAVSLLEPD